MNHWPLQRVSEQSNILSLHSFFFYTSQEGFCGLQGRTSTDTQLLRDLRINVGLATPNVCAACCMCTWKCFIYLLLFFNSPVRRMKKVSPLKLYLSRQHSRESFCVYNHLNLSYHLRQYPNSGTMIECCFYSRDTLMLVPQTKIFI